MKYANSEGYKDPTAGKAIGSTTKKEKKTKSAAVEKHVKALFQSLATLISLTGFELEEMKIKDKETGKRWRMKEEKENERTVEKIQT